MSRRKGLNQIQTLVEFAQGQPPVAVPAGVVLNADEALLWPVFTRARASSDWKEVDLVLLVQAVKLEVEIRRHQQRLDQEGPLVTTASGACKANPLFQIVDTLRRSQGSIIRMLGLVRQGDPRTINARAAKARTYAQDPFAEYDEDLYAKPDDGLLAKPWSS